MICSKQPFASLHNQRYDQFANLEGDCRKAHEWAVYRYGTLHILQAKAATKPDLELWPLTISGRPFLICRIKENSVSRSSTMRTSRFIRGNMTVRISPALSSSSARKSTARVELTPEITVTLCPSETRRSDSSLTCFCAPPISFHFVMTKNIFKIG